MIMDLLVAEGLELLRKKAQMQHDREIEARREQLEYVEMLFDKLQTGLGLDSLNEFQPVYNHETNAIWLYAYGEKMSFSAHQIKLGSSSPFVERSLFAEFVAAAWNAWNAALEDAVKGLQDDKCNYSQYQYIKSKLRRFNGLWNATEVVTARREWLKRHVPAEDAPDTVTALYESWIGEANDVGLPTGDVAEMLARTQKRLKVLEAISNREFGEVEVEGSYPGLPTEYELTRYAELLKGYGLEPFKAYEAAILDLRCELLEHQEYEENRIRRLKAQEEAFYPFRYYKVFYTFGPFNEEMDELPEKGALEVLSSAPDAAGWYKIVTGGRRVKVNYVYQIEAIDVLEAGQIPAYWRSYKDTEFGKIVVPPSGAEPIERQ